MKQTLQHYIGHDSFRVVISDRWPPNNGEGFGRWLQHIDGTLLFYVRGVVGPSDGYNADTCAKDAFGTLNVCSYCVGTFSHGKATCYGRTWNRESIEYEPVYGTTERRPRPTAWANPCCHCRERLVREAVYRCKAECEKLGYAAVITLRKSEGGLVLRGEE